MYNLHKTSLYTSQYLYLFQCTVECTIRDCRLSSVGRGFCLASKILTRSNTVTWPIHRAKKIMYEYFIQYAARRTVCVRVYIYTYIYIYAYTQCIRRVEHLDMMGGKTKLLLKYINLTLKLPEEKNSETLFLFPLPKFPLTSFNYK